MTTFLSDTWNISKGDICHGKKNDTLYMKMDGCEFIAVVESKEDSNLWH